MLSPGALLFIESFAIKPGNEIFSWVLGQGLQESGRCTRQAGRQDARVRGSQLTQPSTAPASGYTSVGEGAAPCQACLAAGTSGRTALSQGLRAWFEKRSVATGQPGSGKQLQFKVQMEFREGLEEAERPYLEGGVLCGGDG